MVMFVSFMLVNVINVSEIFADYTDAQNVIDKGEAAILTGDTLFLFIITGLSLFVILSAAIIRTHPALFIIGFFALSISLMFAAIMSNAFYHFYSGSASMISVSSNFPKILFLMNNLPFYLGFMGLAGLISGIIGYNKQ